MEGPATCNTTLMSGTVAGVTSTSWSSSNSRNNNNSSNNSPTPDPYIKAKVAGRPSPRSPALDQIQEGQVLDVGGGVRQK